MSRCEPVDEHFLGAAPFQLRSTLDIARPVDQVWADLTGDRPLAWCRIVQRIDWTSPRPFGIGATRVARLLGGANVVHERFFRWEEGRRQSWYAERTRAPGFRRLAEDYSVEPLSAESCRLQWTIALEPRAWARPLAPVNRALLGTLFVDTRRHYDAEARVPQR